MNKTAIMVACGIGIGACALMLVMIANLGQSAESESNVRLNPPPRPEPVCDDYTEAMDLLGYDNWGWSGEEVFPGFALTMDMLSGVYPFHDAVVDEQREWIDIYQWNSGKLQSTPVGVGTYSGQFGSGNMGQEGMSLAAEAELNALVGARRMVLSSPQHPEWSARVWIRVFPSCQLAREATLARLASREVLRPYLKVPADDDYLPWVHADPGSIGDLGDVNFRFRDMYTGGYLDPDTDLPGEIEFLRRNVWVHVRALGKAANDIYPGALGAAMAIDALLQAVEPIDPAQLDARRAQIYSNYQRPYLLGGGSTAEELLTGVYLGESEFSFTVSPPVGFQSIGFLTSTYFTGFGVLGMNPEPMPGVPGMLSGFSAGTENVVYIALDLSTLLVAVRSDPMTVLPR